jgi:hypothetical protein
MRRGAAALAALLIQVAAMAQNAGSDNTAAVAAPGAATPETKSLDAAGTGAADKPAGATKVSLGYIHQFNTAISPDGAYSADRVYGGVSSRWMLSEILSLSFGMGYEYDSYNFSGVNAFTAAAWNNVNTLSIVPRFDVALDRHWSVGAAPILQLSGEANADAGRTITGGGLANFRYAFDESLVLGLGVLAKGQLNNTVLVVPAPLIDWEITKGLRLSNLRGPEANPYYGLELVAELAPQFNAALGGAWEYRMFRLDNSGPTPNGTGQEQQISLYGRFEWHPTAQLRFDFVVGAAVMNQLKLRTSSNNLVASEDGGTGLVLGVFGSFRF